MQEASLDSASGSSSAVSPALSSSSEVSVVGTLAMTDVGTELDSAASSDFSLKYVYVYKQAKMRFKYIHILAWSFQLN